MTAKTQVTTSAIAGESPLSIRSCATKRVSPINPQVTDIQQSICTSAARPLPQAIALDGRAYTDHEFYQWEVNNLLKKQWLCVGHVSQIPQVGDYHNFDLLGEAMMLVRGQDREVRVLSRICPHRAMDLMPSDFGHATTGNRRSFLCPYHRWSFSLDGQMLGAPEMHQSLLCDGQNMPLQKFRSAVWEGFIFVTFDADLEPIEQHYAGLQTYVNRWQMAEFEVVCDLNWDCQFNWKSWWKTLWKAITIWVPTIKPLNR